MAIFRFGMDRICDRCGAHTPFLLILAVISTVLYVTDSQITHDLDAIKAQLILLTPIMFAAVIAVSHQLQRFTVLNTVISFLARHSLTVFFCHDFILNLLRPFAVFRQGNHGMLLLLTAALAVSVTVSWLLDTIVDILRSLIRKARSSGQSDQA